MSTRPAAWTLLPLFTFRADEAASASGENIETVKKVLDAFTIPSNAQNDSFCALDDFNITTAMPILRFDADSFILFQTYSLYEALYDSPFFWMLGDNAYKDAATTHRGEFTERFSAKCLGRVFGDEHVFQNAVVRKDSRSIAGEIDVLVLFGNRAIILQAKSKRLTLAARKGNDGVIKDDFKKSIQDSYGQARECAEFILNKAYKVFDEHGNPIDIPNLDKLYLLCIVSDHYPALSFQARQFLQFSASAKVPAPFVMDVFTLDIMTEILDSPLYFLSYIDRRTEYADKVAAAHELTILSFHLKRNLWMSGEYDRIMLDDDISTDLDAAMLVRREGLPGKRTPAGILTTAEGTAFGRLIEQIEHQPNPELLDLGFALLRMNGQSVSQISQGLDHIVDLTKRDKRAHDFSMGAGDGGLTVHCNMLPRLEAQASLASHVQVRKYRGKSSNWFGLNISPVDGRLQFGYNAIFPWEPDSLLEEESKGLNNSSDIRFVNGVPRRKKIGRNEPCHCGSGKKYKRCHGA